MNHSSNLPARILKGLAGTFFFVLLDQLTKYLAVLHLKNKPGIVLLPGVFELTYLENTGAAWGIFGGKQIFFLIVTALLVLAVFFAYCRSPREKSYRIFRLLCVILAAGAMGNALDRLFRGYVVDFFYFSLIDFPVFNVADCYICISLALLLFVCRNEEFVWMKKS